MPDTLIAARFNDAEALCDAIAKVREAGYEQLDAWLPYPNEKVEQALALPPSNIARWSAAGGCMGGVAAYLVLWWTNVMSYPVVVGGFAPHAPVAFLPIVFETTILFAVLGAVGAFFFKTGLPRWYRPEFAVPGIEEASNDAYFLLVNAPKEPADIDTCEARLRALSPLAVHRVVQT